MSRDESGISRDESAAGWDESAARGAGAGAPPRGAMVLILRSAGEVTDVLVASGRPERIRVP